MNDNIQDVLDHIATLANAPPDCEACAENGETWPSYTQCCDCVRHLCKECAPLDPCRECRRDQEDEHEGKIIDHAEAIADERRGA